MSNEFYSEKRASFYHKNYLVKQFHPKINHPLSKFVIETNNDVILEFFVKTACPSSISESYYFVKKYHSFFERSNDLGVMEDWLYLNSYGQETLLINLSTRKNYHLSNRWFGDVSINPIGTIFARIGHVWSDDSETHFYELTDPDKNIDCLILLPFNENIGNLRLLNKLSRMETYEWIENDVVKYVEDEYFCFKSKKFICEMDDDEFDDDFIEDDKHCDSRFYCQLVLKKINNQMHLIEKIHSPESSFYGHESLYPRFPHSTEQSNVSH